MAQLLFGVIDNLDIFAWLKEIIHCILFSILRIKCIRQAKNNELANINTINKFLLKNLNVSGIVSYKHKIQLENSAGTYYRYTFFESSQKYRLGSKFNEYRYVLYLECEDNNSLIFFDRKKSIFTKIRLMLLIKY